MEINIIYEDDDIIVLYKPSKIATETKSALELDVVSYLKNYMVKKKDKPYIALISRLDKMVEGLILVAKNKKSASILSDMQRKREIQKYYYAVVHYKNNEKNLEKFNFIDYLIKDGRIRKSFVSDKKNKDSKKAELKATVKEIKDNKALLTIELLTGRFHQIRCQLSYHNMPIIGDKKYGICDNYNLSLCSYKICFIHPRKQKEMNFEIVPKGEQFLEFSTIKNKINEGAK